MKHENGRNLCCFIKFSLRCLLLTTVVTLACLNKVNNIHRSQKNIWQYGCHTLLLLFLLEQLEQI